MTKLRGIFAAAMSVLNSDLSLNVEKTIDHAEKLIDQGCHGTAIFGSTGQSQLIPISEKINLAVISAHKDANFTEIKSVLQTLLKIGFGIQINTKTVSNSTFKDGHCANIVFNGNVIGIIGEINSTIIENYKIRVPVVGFEISLSDSILKSL